MSLVSSKTFRENDELVSDLARFSEGVLTEKQVRKKWHLLDESAWVAIGADDIMVEMVEAEQVRRIRNGAAKREKAQLHVVRAPDVLEKILSDERASPKHRIDAAKTLDGLAGFAPERPAVDSDRVIIHIDMGADTRARGLASDPADVLHVEAEVGSNPNPDAVRVIDAAPQSIPYQEEDVVPPRRGPGRPRGSRNKPKVVEERPKGVPGFILD